MNKKFILLFTGVIILPIILVASIIYLTQNRSSPIATIQATIYFNTVDGAKVELYRGAYADIVQPQTTGKPVAQVESGKSYALEDWPYVLKVSGQDIAASSQIIYPQRVDKTVTVSVERSSDTLESLLADNSGVISDAISASNPQITELYAISDIRLHGDGNWATAKLTYTGTDKWSRDTLHTIVHKEAGEWSIAAPPSITINKTEVPGAPQSVLWAVIPGNLPPT